MFDSLFTVLNQVAAMFIIMAVGFALVKLGKLKKDGAAQINKIVLNIVIPCVIVDAFTTSFRHDMLGELALSFLLAIIIHLAGIIITKLFFNRTKRDDDRTILRMASIYSNCGFMGLPIISAVLGGEGVIYGSIYIVIFNAFVWTHGICTLKGGKTGISLKALFNPGIIGITVSLLIIFLKLNLPNFAVNALSMLADLNTPLAMLITGAYLAYGHPLKAFGDGRLYLVSFLKLLVMPAVLIGVAVLLKADITLIRALAISAGTPTASIVVLFSAEYGKNSSLAGGVIAVTTLLSVLTLPIIVYCTGLL